MVIELKTKLESEKKINQRLKEIFHSKIQEFRKVYYSLTGYQIDMTCESQYRVTSMYAEHKEDCLIFRVANDTAMLISRIIILVVYLRSQLEKNSGERAVLGSIRVRTESFSFSPRKENLE
ncbi:UNVERIFIED_CONTAM: hypothetical protein K2H54_022690 [Gekko kuhli]